MFDRTGSFSGRLVRMPFPDTVSIAELRVLPLFTEQDLDSAARFKSHSVPVLLNVREHYQLLSLLTEKALSDIPSLTILIRFSMPGGVQIAPQLLRPEILILQDVQAEKERVLSEKKTLLVIDDNFAHFEIDNGDNLISLELFAGKSQGLDLVNELSQILLAHGVIAS